jgi:hypothetical protein
VRLALCAVLLAAGRGRRVFTIEGGNSPGFAFTSALEALDVPR